MAREKIIDIRSPQKGNRPLIGGSKKEERNSEKKPVFKKPNFFESKKTAERPNKEIKEKEIKETGPDKQTAIKNNRIAGNQPQSQAKLNDFIKFFSLIFSLKKKIIFVLPFFALVGVYFFSVSYSRATVEIWPATEEISFDVTTTLDQKLKKTNFESAAIPAEIIEEEKTVSGNFPATGKVSKETKAEGVITVYNNYSPSYQILVQNTRFVSSEGKVFRALERVMIPGGTYENGKLKAGEINIRVVADSLGEAYNIGPDTFSIPGFAGTDRYTKFYGKSFQAFSGGASATASVVTAADLNNAEGNLIEQAKEEIERELKNTLAADNVASVYDFLETGVETEILEKKSSVKAGDEAQEFTTEVKTVSKTLLFKKEDVRNFAKNYIADKLPEGKKIYDPSLKIEYSQAFADFDFGTARVSLKISSLIYSDIDEKAVKNSISQKSVSEIKIFLSSQPEIKDVVVKMWPFWLARSPEKTERIDIRVSFGAMD